VVGQRARFERYAAEMLFIIASGQHVDAEKSPRFGTIVDEIYRNPFVKREKPMSAEDIRQYTLRKVREALKAYQKGGTLCGIDEARREAAAG